MWLGLYGPLLRQEGAVAGQLQWIPEWGAVPLNWTAISTGLSLRAPSGSFYLIAFTKGFTSLTGGEVTMLDNAITATDATLSWTFIEIHSVPDWVGVSIGAGPDDDTLYGTYGNDNLDGGAGNDAIYGNYNGTGNDILHGGTGNDLIYGSADWSQLYGDDGNDTLNGGNGGDTLREEVHIPLCNAATLQRSNRCRPEGKTLSVPPDQMPILHRQWSPIRLRFVPDHGVGVQAAAARGLYHLAISAARCLGPRLRPGFDDRRL